MNHSKLFDGQAFTIEDQSRTAGFHLWVMTFDLKGEKVNKLGTTVLKEMEQVLDLLEKSKSSVDALMLRSGKPGNFIAGADINMIQSAKSEEDARNLCHLGHSLFCRWEDLPFPTVVAIDGAALGGGCELSLSSTAIVMSNSSSSKIGLPEVMLGIIPGLGGCIRLPGKVGIATALDMILTSKQLDGERAVKAGLAEACLPKENFEESVVKWIHANLSRLKKREPIAREPKLGGMGGPVGKLLEKTPMGRNFMLKKAREGVMKQTRGNYPAPLEAIEVIQSTGVHYGPKLQGVARDTALRREAVGFGKMAVTEVSKNLIRIFFMTEVVKKSNGLPEGNNVRVEGVKMAGVLGAGVMGGGIAQLFASKDLPTRMKDLNSKALALGIQAASRIFKKQVERKRLTQRAYLQKLNLIAPSLDYSGFMGCDVVVEAVIEKMDIKKKVFQDLEKYVTPDCVVASNTSSLSISEMQTVMKYPERFAGMHFFNPVHKMPLVEVIRGSGSSDRAVATVFELSKKLGKTPIVVKDAPGFLVNRLLAPYLNEATYLLAEGVPIPELDRALLKFGMPMGPMELIDEVGVDVGEKVAHILHDAFGPRMLPSQLNAKLVAAERLGKKNGKGLYVYSGKDNRKKDLDAGVYQLMGVTPQPGKCDYEEIVDRCILPMINEASRCLDESIVTHPSEVDLGMIMGTGFPPFRGGLLRYADSLGAKVILEKLRAYETRFGERFAPAPRILKMAENGSKFHSS